MNNRHDKVFLIAIFVTVFLSQFSAYSIGAMTADTFTDGKYTAKLQVKNIDELKSYTISTTAPLRDNEPKNKIRTFSESADFPYIRTGNEFFDALYALTLDDARLNAVSRIRDGSFEFRPKMNNSFFQTGEKWTYVWTRDISYSVDLGLACLDAQRCTNSLLFKTTRLKPGIEGRYCRQIVQDTGSGGSYPVSTDRVVWAIGALKLLNYLDTEQRTQFAEDAWQIIHDTIEHDRRIIFDTEDGLYRGEQSFLDWRQQTYPGWTKNNVLAIAESKALSTNIGHYALLKAAARLANYKGLFELEDKYNSWAEKLKKSINDKFYIDSKGLYSSIILQEPYSIRLNRYDLLGQSLAILYGIADSVKSKKIIANYPQSKYGPPVVWPQEQTVPIYHNHAFWPFVTAYWLKAAKQAGNSAAVNQAIYSLVRGTALNLSNMENYDFVTGNAYAEIDGISGPVINSRRQLWSVAGYMAMVQDAVFGLETNLDGIRFRPCITANLHREYFKKSRSLELKNFKYQGKVINVILYLPVLDNKENGIYKIDKIILNNQKIDSAFISANLLESENDWQIWLMPADDNTCSKINIVEDLSRRNIFGPKQPQWKTVGQGGITVENGKLELHYDSNGEKNVKFNIYRNGKLCAEAITQTQWLDPESEDYEENTYYYMIEAFYPDSGNYSHLTPAHFYHLKDDVIEISADSMKNKGGNLVNNNHFENWGQPQDELQTGVFTLKDSGTYLINAEYSNGAGPINTGITCAVKRIEIFDSDNEKSIASSYLIMPQTADWTRYLDSSSFRAVLKSGKKYSIKIMEDEYSLNMSYFDHYECYKGTGNGTGPYNYVNISRIKLIRISN